RPGNEVVSNRLDFLLKNFLFAFIFSFFFFPLFYILKNSNSFIYFTFSFIRKSLCVVCPGNDAGSDGFYYLAKNIFLSSFGILFILFFLNWIYLNINNLIRVKN